MKPTPANVQQITEKDLAELISIEREGLTVDFKVDLYQRDKLAHEWAKDVTAFANTSGGCLILGMDEVGGLASALPGIEILDPDALIRQMQQSLTSNTDPAPFVRFQIVDLSNKKKALLVGVPQSRNAPHAVRGKDSLTFYRRTDASLCERMTVNEIRKSFQQAQSVEEQCREHHLKTCASLRTNGDGINVYLSLFPLPVGEERLDFANNKIRTDALQIDNITEEQGQRRLTFAGHLHSREGPAMTQTIDRCGVFSEASFAPDKDALGTITAIPPGWLLCRLAATMQSVFEFYKKVGINGPVLAMASAWGCRGRVLVLTRPDYSKSITEDRLDFPAILFDEFPPHTMESLQPWGLRLWQAGGVATCPLYDWPSGKLNVEALRPFQICLR